jgi:hypothetical protein
MFFVISAGSSFVPEWRWSCGSLFNVWVQRLGLCCTARRVLGSEKLLGSQAEGLDLLRTTEGLWSTSLFRVCQPVAANHAPPGEVIKITGAMHWSGRMGEIGNDICIAGAGRGWKCTGGERHGLGESVGRSTSRSRALPGGGNGRKFPVMHSRLRT